MSDPSIPEQWRLHRLSFFSKIGLTCLILVFGVGIAASLQHIVNHHGKKDGQPGLSLEDVTGSYHGVKVSAPLATALKRGHPDTLPAPSRALLEDWILGKADVTGKRPAGGNPRLVEDYDNLDMGDSAPIEIIAKNCLSCHSAKGAQEIAAKGDAAAKKAGGWPLDSLENVKKLAFEKEITPPGEAILVQSTHAHAISLATMSVALGGLLVLTRWPRVVVGVLILLAGCGLLADIGGWWAARKYAWAVYLLMAGGAAYSISSVLTLAAVFADLWLPRKR